MSERKVYALTGITLFLLAVFLYVVMSLQYVATGYEGIRVQLYGTEKGVDMEPVGALVVIIPFLNPCSLMSFTNLPQSSVHSSF